MGVCAVCCAAVPHGPSHSQWHLSQRGAGGAPTLLRAATSGKFGFHNVHEHCSQVLVVVCIDSPNARSRGCRVCVRMFVVLICVCSVELKGLLRDRSGP